MNKTIFTLLTIILFASCQKKGELLTSPEYFEVTLKWFYTPNNLTAYRVEVEGEKLTDSLMYGSAPYNLVTKVLSGSTKGMKRLVLKVNETDSTVLDTTFEISGKTTLQLLAIDPTDRPQIMKGNSGGSEEADPADRSNTKIRYYYSDPKLPDSIKMIFYRGNPNVRPFTYEQPSVAELVVKRSEFSSYLDLKMDTYGRNTYFLFQIINAQTGEMVQDISITSTVLANAIGYTETMSATSTKASNGLPNFKIVTTILKWGEADAPAARRNKFHDQPLFQTRW
ncbi:hypothetical protein [Chitinophaga barathri]|uniref:Uncharacterized protein n=1 Tax=Chitinophaga barathri TaxID=1647451 RepID=A0A3N4M994_9BACT|nr:hypothetical protein [Chitinophaga barathri]RPD38176.1 hypothetical protein EG028_26310 [Chitinophaga barathri]